MQTIDLSAPEHVTRILNIAYTMRVAGRYIADINGSDPHVGGDLLPYMGDPDQAVAAAAIEYQLLLEKLADFPTEVRWQHPHNPKHSRRATVALENGKFSIQVNVESP